MTIETREMRQSGNLNQPIIDLTRISSISAEHPHSRVGEHYAFIPTQRVVEVLKEENWLPVKAYEVKARSDSRMGFQKHLIRFRHQGSLDIVKAVGDIFPEIVLTNAHDGTAAFIFMAGLFRLACLNGMVVADSMFETFKIRHQGFQNRNVIRAARSISETTPLIMNRVNEFKQIELDVPEQVILAEEALALKYDEEQVPNFNTEQLLLPVRQEDSINNNRFAVGRNTLWNIYNTLQEKLVEKGGRFARKLSANGSFSGMKKAKPIKSITENIRINRGLWSLTEKMAELKAGAK
jgi:hypothetical protein